MTQEIFIVLGLVMFVDALFEKWGVWEYIAKVGSGSSSETIFQLSQCEFCLKFHLSVVLTLILSIFVGFEWSILIVPGVVSGLIRLIDR
jgi:hypothetical protein